MLELFERLDLDLGQPATQERRELVVGTAQQHARLTHIVARSRRAATIPAGRIAKPPSVISRSCDAISVRARFVVIVRATSSTRRCAARLP
jgi:hypothetical protein